ncbi:MAG TPA: hypothetical protein VMZ92_18660 [Planctomycetota bacterium]|nr:hypothetical protein [Planctomycetota bacterium]
MPGYPLTEDAVGRWRRVVDVVQPRTLAVNLAVGVLAGLAAAHVRLGLGLPGHKLLLWMTPIVAARLLSRHPLGGTAGACAAGCTSLAFGGNLAGGILLLPLVGVAGAVLDGAAAFAEHRRLSRWLLVPLLGLGGTTAGAVCALKRLLTVTFNRHVMFGFGDVTTRLMSYALFGLIAGTVGAGLALCLLAGRRHGDTPKGKPRGRRTAQ